MPTFSIALLNMKNAAITTDRAEKTAYVNA